MCWSSAGCSAARSWRWALAMRGSRRAGRSSVHRSSWRAERLGILARPRRVPPVPPHHAGAHALPAPRAGPTQRAGGRGSALLTPNHVSFADGLFVIASIDRPIRFVVYADYFERPLLGAFLRAMRAIPISGTGGPKMILQAFREAGRRLDEGELVCIFSRRPDHPDRSDAAVSAGTGADRQGSHRADHPGPHRPRHREHFQPDGHARLPDRIPLPVTVSFGAPLPPNDASPRNPPGHPRARPRGVGVPQGRPPAAPPRVHQAGANASVPPGPGRCSPAAGLRHRGTRRLRSPWRARCGRSWEGQEHVGILLPTGVGAALVNLAATLSGRATVNLNFTAGRAAMGSAATQAGLRTVVTSRVFLEKAKIELPEGVEPIWIEEVRGTRSGSTTERSRCCSRGSPRPGCSSGRAALEAADDRRHRNDHFQQRQHGRSQGSGALALEYRVECRGDRPGFPDASRRPDSRHPADVPLVRLPALWLAMGRGLGLVCHGNPARSGERRRPCSALSGDDPAGDADVPPALPPPLLPGAVRLAAAGGRGCGEAARSRWRWRSRTPLASARSKATG